MKWYEIACDAGDGTTYRERFRTFEEAQTWRDKIENCDWFQQDGDGSPVVPVDTDAPGFFHDPADDEDEI